MNGLTKQQTDSIKQSFLDIVAMFENEDSVPGRYLMCLLTWAAELRMEAAEIRRMNAPKPFGNLPPGSDKMQKIEAIYHLVHMISMDNNVEDVELEIASMYAENLGFRRSIVSDVLKAIVTADTDETPPGDIRQQVIDFIKLHEE